MIVLASLVLFTFMPLDFTGLFVSVTSGEMNLTLWDVTDSQGGSYKVYASGSPLGGGPSSTTLARFFTNYTNVSSGESINGSGVECNISFNLSGGWSSPEIMWFNSTSRLYEYNRSFVSRGFYYWNVTCDGSSQGFGSISATDNMTVQNTPAGIYVPLAAKNCTEDEYCNYTFSADCYDIDDVDENNLTYSYVYGTEFTGFGMDTETGNITIYVTDDTDCGEFKVSLTVQDPMGDGAVANKTFIINAVNDPPVLGGLLDSAYQNSSFYHDVDATDEDSSGPFNFNMTFLECYRPFSSEHSNVTNCSGLLSINSTTGVINRSGVFGNWEVGNYTINFTVTDPGDNLTGTSIPPYTWLSNMTDWQVINLTVHDINDPPVISPVGNQYWIQNENRVLVINATDVDNGTLVFNLTTLYRNLSVYYNSSLFPITLNETLLQDNGTSLANATMNFTPVLNNQVGNYTVNISVHDGRENGTVSVLVNFTVLNVNDPPNISFSCRNYSVQELEYYCDIGENTTDPDDFPSYQPYSDTVNGTMSFYLDFTYCNKTFNQSDTNCSIFTINSTTGVINYTSPQRKDSGNYTLNISVTDGGGITSSVLLNFTVVPDYPPSITTSVPPQNTRQGLPFYLSANATDPDNATDNLTFRTETYMNGTLMNSTLFPVETDRGLWPPGPASGIMNYTSVSNSQVGNYTVKLIVNDTWEREDFILFNITVENVNDPPAINFSCSNQTDEDDEYICNVAENTSDPDLQTPQGESLAYSMVFLSGLPLFGINSTTGLINFTASNDSWANGTYNFTYPLNITVTDSNGSVDSSLFNLTIHAVNDPPDFNFTNTSGFQNAEFFMDLSLNATDEEGDTPFFYSMSFTNCSRKDSDTNCSILDINQTTGVINRTDPFSSGEVGNYTINVTVKDSGNFTQPYNASRSQIVNFTVHDVNEAPSVDIAGVIYYYPNGSLAPVAFENNSILFAISLSDPDGDTLYCTWFRNGTQIANIDGCEDENSWTYVPDFESSGTWNFRLEASDSYFTRYDEWTLGITNVNRPPSVVYPIQNQTWNMNTVNKNIILSYNFQDPDNENNVTNDDNNLSVNHTVTSYVAVLIDDQSGTVTLESHNYTGSGVVTLTPQTDWYGMDYVTFHLSDGEYNITGNNITLNVSYTETPTQTIVEQVSGGSTYTTTESKIASLTITTSPMERIGSYNETATTVTLQNTGEVALNGVNISSYVNESDEISLSLSRTYVSQIGVGENITTNLTIKTEKLTEETYEIKVTGSVNEPKFNQSTVIYLRPIYDSTRVMDRISLAKDLFQDNPECLDLTELILEAERQLGQDNLERARELTETALDNCRDIITYTNMTKKKVTPDEVRIPINEIMIVLLTIALLTILIYTWLERREESRRKKK